LGSGKIKNKTLNKFTTDEKGQALVIVTLLMLLSALVIAPMLSHVSTGLKTGKEVYEERTYGQYAADSGVEDALFKLQTNYPLLPEEWDGAWLSNDVYDTPYAYSLDSPVNGNNIDVTIEPQWVLTDLESPPENMMPHADLMIVGHTVGEEDGNSIYQIAINYNESIGLLTFEKLGIWLPNGYDYVPGSCTLEEDPHSHYYCVPTVTEHHGGNAVVWTFDPPKPKFGDLPGEGDTRIITLKYTPTGFPNAAFSWVMASRTDIYLSWDLGLKYYKITSNATDVDTGKINSVETYVAENESKEMGISIAGEYCATGNTLMTGDPPIRDVLLDESDATVGDIPAGANILAAYLYWSAWLGRYPSYVFYDDCLDFINWSAGSNWECVGTPPSVRFMASGGATDGTRTITMVIPETISLDLSAYADYDLVRVTWDQDVSSYVDAGDGLYIALYDGRDWSDDIEVFLGDSPPSHYTYAIPREYISDSFRMRLFWDAGSSNEKVYIDNIKIEAYETVCDESVIFKVNGTHYHFDSNGDPVSGSGEITANAIDRHYLENFIGSGVPNGYSYACKKDVTELVKLAGVTNGNATYTVGGVDCDTGDELSYAVWSLIIIYYSPDVDRHQIYLYDDNFIYSSSYCNVDFDNNGTPGGLVSGFLAPEDVADTEHAARLTCFVGEGDRNYSGDRISVNGCFLSNAESPSNNVWNETFPGNAKDGIDIDTFEVTYPTINPGDTSAKVDLPTETDCWNLVYIILSFSTDITSNGGVISYEVR
jgi:Flp pilus assembly pilin Flp